MAASPGSSPRPPWRRPRGAAAARLRRRGDGGAAFGDTQASGRRAARRSAQFRARSAKAASMSSRDFGVDGAAVEVGARAATPAPRGRACAARVYLGVRAVLAFEHVERVARDVGVALLDVEVDALKLLPEHALARRSRRPRRARARPARRGGAEVELLKARLRRLARRRTAASATAAVVREVVEVCEGERGSADARLRRRRAPPISNSAGAARRRRRRGGARVAARRRSG